MSENVNHPSRIEQIRKLGEIEWTESEKAAINKAFAEIDTIVYECAITGQEHKAEALWTARYGLEKIATAIAVRQLVDELNQ